MNNSSFNIRNLAQNYNWSNRSILVVDDDSVSYAYLNELLSYTGAKVYYAENGLRALSECLKNQEIELVLMDIKMPVVDGLESTRLIKKYKPGMKIVAQTAFAMPNDIDRCLHAGCNDYITKPVLPDELFHKIELLFNSVTENLPESFFN